MYIYIKRNNTFRIMWADPSVSGLMAPSDTSCPLNFIPLKMQKSKTVQMNCDSYAVTVIEE